MSGIRLPLRVAAGVLLVTGVLAAACGRTQGSADSTAALIVDTLKPAGVSAVLPPPDTVRPAGALPAPTSPSAKSTGSKTSAGTAGTQTKQGATSTTKELGRDSIIRRDLGDKRRQLPPIDTTQPR